MYLTAIYFGMATKLNIVKYRLNMMLCCEGRVIFLSVRRDVTLARAIRFDAGGSGGEVRQWKHQDLPEQIYEHVLCDDLPQT